MYITTVLKIIPYKNLNNEEISKINCFINKKNREIYQQCEKRI